MQRVLLRNENAHSAMQNVLFGNQNAHSALYKHKQQRYFTKSKK